MRKIYKPKKYTVLTYGTFNKAIVVLHPQSRWKLESTNNYITRISNHSTVIEVSCNYLEKYFEEVESGKRT